MPKKSQNNNNNNLSSVAMANPWYLKLWRPKSLVVTYTETMRRNTKTNIKTGITKHKHSSPQSCRSSLQRQEVPEGESQEGTCDDQLSVAVLVRRCWWWGWWKGAPWERVRLLFKYGEGAIQGEQSYVVPPFHLEDMEGRGIWEGESFCVLRVWLFYILHI